MNICVLLLISIVTAFQDKYLNQLIYKFIYSNEHLCGDPFIEANWLLAMNECNIECEPTEYICLVSTSQSDVQKCRKLTSACTAGIRKYLGWSMKNESIQPSTTTSTQSPPTRLFATTPAATISPPAEQKQFGSNTQLGRNSFYIKDLEPIENVNFIDDRYDEDERDSKPSFVVEPPAFSPKTFYTKLHYKNVLNIKPIKIMKVKPYSPRPKMGFTTTSVPVLNRFENAQELFEKMELEQKMAAKLAEEKTSQKFERVPIDDEPEFNEGSAVIGSRIEIIPPFPPLDPPHWDEQTSGKAIEKDYIRDYNKKCCEWAIQGLCDSYWQKVRQICAKSCRSVVCEDVEGVKSCYRLIDVDIEECYQSIRSNHFLSLPTYEKKDQSPYANSHHPLKKTKSKKSKRRRTKKKLLK
ncbi:unnamed protein product [Caenorhabditis bovis]|uniref:Uncharacterized protein n=1 Tax=Caenorhabditis bovis TaxID=2654633 RepID=A0A8S1EGD7_9PELO|nr:unnamed protein product [Caenorhabditis bovis]